MSDDAGRNEQHDEQQLDGYIRRAMATSMSTSMSGGGRPAPAPPGGFPDRVMAALRQRRRRAHIALVTAVAAAAVLIPLVVWRPVPGARTGADTGVHVAISRQEIPLGGRGVAVMEPGSELSWTEGGRRWQQQRGDVFYRVEPGGALRVQTPAGEVEVLGTCFRVEVDPMNINRQGKIGAAVGAGLATLVVVTVYEGRVRLASGKQQLALGAGERGQMSAGSGPVRVVAGGPAAGGPASPNPGASIPRLVAAGSGAAPEVAAELQRLKQLVSDQQAELSRLKMERGGRTGEHRYVDVSKEELLARAARCEIRYDTPPILDAVPKPVRTGDLGGLTETERDAVNEVMTEMNADVGRQLRKLYAEIGGDMSVADGMSPGSLVNELMQKLPPDDGDAARARLARERAGLQPAPADLNATPPAERLFRLMFQMGDEFERRLGERIGAERAHSLRARRDGWGGSRSSHSGCKSG